MANINLGRVSPLAVGEYDNTITYDKLDIVNYQNSSYIAKKSVPAGTSITNDEYWQLLAEGAGQLSIGTVNTVSASTGASASITGSYNAPVLNLNIPRGVAGNESIDDTAGEGDTDKVWSADKSWKLTESLNFLNITSDDVVQDTVIAGATGDALPDKTNYVCTDYIDISNTISQKIQFNGILYSTYGFSFYNAAKIFISGINGSTASTYGYQNTTTPQRINISVPDNAYYIRITLSKAAYVSPSSFGIVTIKEGFTRTDNYKKSTILTYGQTKTLTDSDLEAGGIQDGTGKLVNSSTRLRNINYVNVYKGMIIYSVVQFNVFEYDLFTGEYIHSTNGWKHLYTVTQDCKIKMLFNSSSASTVINGLSFETPVISVSPSIIPIDTVEKVAFNYSNSTTIKTIAHRGRYGFRVGMECGASAVIAARAYGINTVENDIQVTSDGEFVMWHDSTLSKIGDSDHSISDYTLEQLKAMDFGSAYGFPGEKILTFEEWIVLCKKVGVECYIDFKVSGENFTNAMAEELVNTVITNGMANHVSYLSNFSKIRTYHTNARLGPLLTPTEERITSYSSLLANGEVFFNPDITALTAENAALALQNGFGLECFYVNSTEDADKTTVFNTIDSAASLGIQGITCNYYKVEDVFNAKYGIVP